MKLLDDILESDSVMDDGKVGGTLYTFNREGAEIEIAESPFSIYEYLRQFQKGKILAQPDYQRNMVWKDIQKNAFIESVLLNYPLPPIYLNETKEASYIVIDGLQRTSTLFEFYSGKFTLAKLRALPQYNGLNYDSLPEALRSKFEDKKLTTFILKPSTPMSVIYDLFNRINTGGTQLNRQEVRNCIFIGKSTQLLRELAEENYFKLAIDGGFSETRMKDREAILRYLAFRWFDYRNRYNGDMSDYVEMAMKKINQLDDIIISQIKKDFQRVMEMSYLIWGDKNFRIPTNVTRGTINIAILESVCNYLASVDDKYIKNNFQTIRDNYQKLIHHRMYLEAVTKSTSNKAKVLNRFIIAHEVLNQNTHD